MLKMSPYAFAAIAVLFLISACASKPVSEKAVEQVAEKVAEQAPAETTIEAVKEAVAVDPNQYLRAAARADNMGRVYAEAVNVSQSPVAKVYVMVVHINPDTRQPDNQSIPLLVAERLEPGESAQIKLEGIQVYKPADLGQYRVIPLKAELAE